MIGQVFKKKGKQNGKNLLGLIQFDFFNLHDSVFFHVYFPIEVHSEIMFINCIEEVKPFVFHSRLVVQVIDGYFAMEKPDNEQYN